MRFLIIKRLKSFAASMKSMQVYVEDYEHGDAVIGGTPCRRLGALKNGEEKSFKINEAATGVYVVSDALANDASGNGYCAIPAGRDDVSLVGQVVAGNVFRFGESAGAGIGGRRRIYKRSIMVALLVIISVIIVGFFVALLPSFMPDEDKDFSANGMNITLNDSFSVDEDNARYTLLFESDNVGIAVLKESFSSIPGALTMTEQQYAELFAGAIGVDADIKLLDDMMCMEYDVTYDTDYHYLCFIYKTEDAFWAVEFTTQSIEADKYRADIIRWAGSISFD